MDRNFVRSKRITDDFIAPLSISVEKRTAKRGSGIAQALINIAVYVAIFLLFFKDNLQTIGIFIAFMAASVVSQIILRFGSSFKRTHKFPFFKIANETKAYKDYLGTVEDEIDGYMKRYRKFLDSNFFAPSRLQGFADGMTPQLFSRLPMHKDFLTLNLGKGFAPYPIEVKYPVLNYSEKDDVLASFKTEMDQKIHNYGRMAIPFGFSLKENKSLALVNKGMTAAQFEPVINGLIADVATLHAKEELTMCFVFDDDMGLEWTRFLPHVWVGNRRLLFSGTEEEGEFTKVLSEGLADSSKHLLAVVDADLARNYRFYETFNSEALPENLSVLFFSRSGVVPTRAACQLDCFYKDKALRGTLGDRQLVLNQMNSADCERLAKSLFRIRVVDNHKVKSNVIPERLTFFELFGIRSAASMPMATMEENRNVQNGLPVLVGRGAENQNVYIDLTNDGDGNHCLVTGTNGSGKSEFLLTYVLAACAKYRPDYLSFVAIDFKGGNMSKKIRNLPHCLGEFTNGSEGVTKRELTRIAELLKSEIRAREALLKEADCENDLARYHRLYAEGKVERPLPRLLILVDEVAVFFANDSAASQYITEIATVGRAVGMILLLATQSKNSVIPSQVRTNVNVTVEFYSGDDDKKSDEKIKGRAIINSHKKNDCACQMALSTLYDSNQAAVDFITLSGKSRVITGTGRSSQFDLTAEEIDQRYPYNTYIEILDEVLPEPLEVCIEDRLTLPQLQELYYGEHGAEEGYPLGICDNIYRRKRQALTFIPGSTNLLVYGKPQSGKTTFLQTLLVSMLQREHGLRPGNISVYVAAKNPEEYASFGFPQIGSILGADGLYYFLKFLGDEIGRRSGESRRPFPPMVAIIDDCYPAIQENETLNRMLSYVTAESVKYNISVIMTTSYKAGFGNGALKNFSSVAALHMGDDYDYNSLLHVDAIRAIPDIRGRALVRMAGVYGRTLETQVALPCEGDVGEIRAMAQNYRDLWSGKPVPQPVPLMPAVVKLPVRKKQRRVPVGLAVDLAPVYWELDLANTYLISYFADADAIRFAKYMTEAFLAMGWSVVLVDNQQEVLADADGRAGVVYYQYDQQKELTEWLKRFGETEESRREKTVLVMFDYVRFMYPSMLEERELIGIVQKLLKEKAIYGAFADMKEFFNSFRYSDTRFVPYIEGANSGLLLGNTPMDHTFGQGSLDVREQSRGLDRGWGINVSPAAQGVRRMKIAGEVAE